MKTEYKVEVIVYSSIQHSFDELFSSCHVSVILLSLLKEL